VVKMPWGWGWRWWFWLTGLPGWARWMYFAPVFAQPYRYFDPEYELKMLEDMKAELEKELEEVKRKIEELKRELGK